MRQFNLDEASGNGFRLRTWLKSFGLRRGELAGLKWEDIDFEKLFVNVTRSVVDQQIGNTKTEVSRKPVPIDDHLAKDLLSWYKQTPYRNWSDWVFTTDNLRAGARRGKQPLWLSTIMRYYNPRLGTWESTKRFPGTHSVTPSQLC